MSEGETGQKPAMADGSWMAWTVAAVVGIWLAVALVSILAPDMVSGSEQEHLPVAACSTWLWGLVATGGFVWGMGKLRGRASRRPIWTGYALATLVVWLVAAVLGITLPRMETGSDPTRIPVAALALPVAAAVLTILAGILASVFARPPNPS